MAAMAFSLRYLLQSAVTFFLQLMSTISIKHFTSTLLAISLSFSVFPGALADEEVNPLPIISQEAGTPVPGRFIVLFKDKEFTLDRLEKKLLKLNPRKQRKIFEKLRGFAGELTPEEVEAFRNDADVELVEPDVIVTAFAQTLPTGINRIDADLSPTAKIDGVDKQVNVDIAIIDTGVQKTHPDLNVFKQVNFTNEKIIDDQNGHGTHVAGIAAALDNKAGVVGVAPGARIWSVKVLDKNGAGYMSDIIEGIDYVTKNASSIEVANMSLGCECVSAALNSALTKSIAAGVVYAVAAGNNAKDAATFSPANHPDVVAVSAIADFNGLPGGGAAKTCMTDVDDTFADFSNFGATVDIAAPGVCIYSTYKGSTYATLSGTSMASPHVAGGIALYLATRAKPTNAAGVLAVKTAVQAAGIAQTVTGGFTGDPDATKEKLLKVSGF